MPVAEVPEEAGHVNCDAVAYSASGLLTAKDGEKLEARVKDAAADGDDSVSPVEGTGVGNGWDTNGNVF